MLRSPHAYMIDMLRSYTGTYNLISNHSYKCTYNLISNHELN